MGKADRIKQLRQPQIKLGDCPDTECAECKGKFFDTVFGMKTVSPILSGQANTLYVRKEFYRCTGCGHVMDGANDPSPMAGQPGPGRN